MTHVEPDKQEAFFTDLYIRYYNLVFNIACRRVQSMDVAEDITQDTFLLAWRHLPTLDTSGNVKGWLCTIVRNLSIDYLRSSYYRRMANIDLGELINSRHDVSEDIAETFAASEPTRNALAHMPKKFASFLTRHYIDKDKSTEIAQDVRLSVHTVHLHCIKARKLFKDEYRKEVIS
jgi:RNA polymerase sigma-70 factor (ECF subfamily)